MYMCVDSLHVFAQEQHIVPDDEWSTFMSTLRENLAATFRITGTRRCRSSFNSLLCLVSCC